MLNPATHYRNDSLNSFTNMIVINQKYEVRTLVRLRDGTMVYPVFKPAEDATCEDAFYADGYRYCWNLDGTSVTRSDYDMMEIVEETK